MASRFGITLATREPLACRIALAASCEPECRVGDLAAAVERATGARVEPFGEAARNLWLRMTEPLELLVAAARLLELRELGPKVGPGVGPKVGPGVGEGVVHGEIRGIAAAAPAMELLRDTSEPTRSLWRAFAAQLAIDELGDRGLVAIAGVGVRAQGFAEAPLALRFPVRDAERTWRAEIFAGAQLTIGRGVVPVDLVIDSDMVARRHCAFVLRSTGWYFRDLNSTGGCFLDGVRVDTVQVASGDVFAIGRDAIEVIAAL